MEITLGGRIEEHPGFLGGLAHGRCIDRPDDDIELRFERAA